jgi:hypothetical protein
MRLLRDRSSYSRRKLWCTVAEPCEVYSGCTHKFIIELVLLLGEQLALTGVLECLYLPLIHDSGIVWFYGSFTPVVMEHLVE